MRCTDCTFGIKVRDNAYALFREQGAILEEPLPGSELSREGPAGEEIVDVDEKKIAFLGANGTELLHDMDSKELEYSPPRRVGMEGDAP